MNKHDIRHLKEKVKKIKLFIAFSSALRMSNIKNYKYDMDLG
jgi:hypothetical protein